MKIVEYYTINNIIDDIDYLSWIYELVCALNTVYNKNSRKLHF